MSYKAIQETCPFNKGDRIKCVRKEHSSPNNISYIEIGVVYTICSVDGFKQMCLAEINAKYIQGPYYHPADFELYAEGGKSNPAEDYDRAMKGI